jgi:hypothetical protein
MMLQKDGRAARYLGVNENLAQRVELVGAEPSGGHERRPGDCGRKADDGDRAAELDERKPPRGMPRGELRKVRLQVRLEGSVEAFRSYGAARVHVVVARNDAHPVGRERKARIQKLAHFLELGLER